MTAPDPIEISDVSLAFPADALDYMPKWEDIPEQYKDGSSPWLDFQRCWMRHGLSAHLFRFVPKEGLAGTTIFRQLDAIQRSFAPKHEHKEAAVAYLAESWIEALAYGPADTNDLADIRVLGSGTREEWVEVIENPEAVKTNVD